MRMLHVIQCWYMRVMVLWWLSVSFEGAQQSAAAVDAFQAGDPLHYQQAAHICTLSLHGWTVSLP